MEVKIEYFTKHINRVLRRDYMVEDWGFSIDPIQELFIVRIDYIDNFHTRDMYKIDYKDIEVLKIEFDERFAIHKDELMERKFGR